MQLSFTSLKFRILPSYSTQKAKGLLEIQCLDQNQRDQLTQLHSFKGKINTFYPQAHKKHPLLAVIRLPIDGENGKEIINEQVKNEIIDCLKKEFPNAYDYNEAINTDCDSQDKSIVKSELPDDGNSHHHKEPTPPIQVPQPIPAREKSSWISKGLYATAAVTTLSFATTSLPITASVAVLTTLVSGAYVTVAMGIGYAISKRSNATALLNNESNSVSSRVYNKLSQTLSTGAQVGYDYAKFTSYEIADALVHTKNYVTSAIRSKDKPATLASLDSHEIKQPVAKCQRL